MANYCRAVTKSLRGTSGLDKLAIRADPDGSTGTVLG
jgi:hypothetical protein